MLLHIETCRNHLHSVHGTWWICLPRSSPEHCCGWRCLLISASSRCSAPPAVREKQHGTDTLESLELHQNDLAPIDHQKSLGRTTSWRHVPLCSFMFFRFVWKDVVFRLGLGRLPLCFLLHFPQWTLEAWAQGTQAIASDPTIPWASHVLCAEDQAVFGHQGLGSPLLRHIGSIVREGFQAKAHLQYGTVWHGQTEKPSMPWKTAVLCTALYHFVPCCNACCNLPTVWNMSKNMLEHVETLGLNHHSFNYRSCFPGDATLASPRQRQICPSSAQCCHSPERDEGRSFETMASPKRCQILPLCNSAVKSDGLDSSRFARF